MRLPNAARAVVPRAKLVDYLLSPTHPRGSKKAAYFQALSFRRGAWETLAAALIEHASENRAVAEDRPGGVIYIVEGSFRTPSGAVTDLRSVWTVIYGADTPRFVTAYPSKRRRNA